MFNATAPLDNFIRSTTLRFEGDGSDGGDVLNLTGAANAVPSEVGELVARIKRCTQLPVCVGFGIHTPQNVRTIASVADGVVIGSWLVDWIDKNWDEGKGREVLVGDIRKLKEATRA